MFVIVANHTLCKAKSYWSIDKDGFVNDGLKDATRYNTKQDAENALEPFRTAEGEFFAHIEEV